MATKKKGLGRGLEALLGMDSGPAPSENDGAAQLRQLKVDLIQPGRYQPRTGMDDERLQELAESIKAQGLIQPITVREIARGRFEIIAGERRWRAAQLAGMSEVPVIVREVDDHATLAIALIENIQREDLSPLEEASAIKRLLETHALEMGHARALLALAPAQAEALARSAAEQQWNVRELEERVRRLGEGAQGKPPGKGGRGGAGKRGTADPDVAQLERELGERINAKVQIQHGPKGRGKLVIEYFSLDELDGILERIK